jgi:hypothetical protein
LNNLMTSSTCVEGVAAALAAGLAGDAGAAGGGMV